jgi:hypothetical protein
MAEISRWDELGRRLRIRREEELGYPFRPEFADAADINERMISDIENNPPGRANTYLNSTLKNTVAPAYQVTYGSIIAFLKGESDELTPVRGRRAQAAQPDDGMDGVMLLDRDREAAVRPIFAEILGRLLGTQYEPGLAETLGVPVGEVTGAQLFGAGTPDAKDWDDPRTRRLFSVRERVWMIAEMRVREGGQHDRAAGSALTAGMSLPGQPHDVHHESRPSRNRLQSQGYLQGA